MRSFIALALFISAASALSIYRPPCTPTTVIYRSPPVNIQKSSSASQSACFTPTIIRTPCVTPTVVRPCTRIIKTCVQPTITKSSSSSVSKTIDITPTITRTPCVPVVRQPCVPVTRCVQTSFSDSASSSDSKTVKIEPTITITPCVTPTVVEPCEPQITIVKPTITTTSDASADVTITPCE